MEAHTCRYCSGIVLDLTDADRYHVSIGKALTFETEFVKLAVQDKCMFFYWALALEEGDVPVDDVDTFLDHHIANLPGVVYEGGSSDQEAEGTDTASNGEEERYDAVRDEDDSIFATTGDEDSDRDTKSFPSSGEGSDATPRKVPSRLALHLESSSIGPKRCVVTRDMASNDAPKRLSIYWAGPEIHFAVPQGTHLTLADSRMLVCSQLF